MCCVGQKYPSSPRILPLKRRSSLQQRLWTFAMIIPFCEIQALSATESVKFNQVLSGRIMCRFQLSITPHVQQAMKPTQNQARLNKVWLYQCWSQRKEGSHFGQEKRELSKTTRGIIAPTPRRIGELRSVTHGRAQVQQESRVSCMIAHALTHRSLRSWHLKKVSL